MTGTQSAPKSEIITTAYGDLKQVLVLQHDPNHCLTGHAAGWGENQGVSGAFQTCLAASRLLPRACRATEAQLIWKDISYQVVGQLFSYISRAEVCPLDS